MKSVEEFRAIYPCVAPETIEHIYTEAYNAGLDAALKTQGIDAMGDLEKRLKGGDTAATAKPTTQQP